MKKEFTNIEIFKRASDDTYAFKSGIGSVNRIGSLYSELPPLRYSTVWLVTSFEVYERLKSHQNVTQLSCNTADLKILIRGCELFSEN